jgi:hypothetical protein
MNESSRHNELNEQAILDDLREGDGFSSSKIDRQVG